MSNVNFAESLMSPEQTVILGAWQLLVGSSLPGRGASESRRRGGGLPSVVKWWFKMGDVTTELK